MIVIMKRSIKRLPKRTQEELAVLQELILQYLVNVRMIILSMGVMHVENMSFGMKHTTNEVDLLTTKVTLIFW